MWLNLHIVLYKQKPYRSFLAAPDMISNVNSLAIVMSSICKPRAIVMSHRSIDGPTRAVPAVAAQTTPAQTASWSIPITNTDLLPGTTSNLHIGNLYGDQYFIYDPVGDKLH